MNLRSLFPFQQPMPHWIGLPYVFRRNMQRRQCTFNIGFYEKNPTGQWDLKRMEKGGDLPILNRQMCVTMVQTPSLRTIRLKERRGNNLHKHSSGACVWRSSKMRVHINQCRQYETLSSEEKEKKKENPRLGFFLPVYSCTPGFRC